VALAVVEPRRLLRSEDADVVHRAQIGKIVILEEDAFRFDPTMGMRTPYTGWVDTMNRYAGEYVAYWGLLAVFASSCRGLPGSRATSPCFDSRGRRERWASN